MTVPVLALRGVGLADSADANSYAYSATSMVAGEFYVLFCVSSHGTAAPAQTPTATGVTFTEKGTAGGQVFPAGTRRLQAFEYQAASTGTLAITISATASTSMDAGVVHLGSADTTTRIIQTVGTTNTAGTSISTTLATLGHADNRVLVCVTHNANEGHTPKGGYTELYDAGHAAPVNAMTILYGADTTPSSSWTSNVQRAIIAMEIKGVQPAGATFGRVYQNGAWRAVTAERVYQNGAWRSVTGERVYQNGAWRTVV